MKILLIYPDFPEWNKGGCFYNGIASVFTYIENYSHHTPSFWHITYPISDESFIENVRIKAPHVIGFSGTTPMFEYIKKWAYLIKKHIPEIFMLCGGIHARCDCEDIFKNSPIEAVCIGEGEEAIIDLLDKIENKENYFNTFNFAFKTNGTIKKNRLKLIKNLDDLPDLNRNIFDHSSLYDYTKPFALKKARFNFGRGCPFNCSFCIEELIRGNYKSKNYCRNISPERAIKQIKDHLNNFPDTDLIWIEDPNINIDLNWFKKFVDLYSREINIPYTCQTVSALCDEEFIKLLIKSHCLYLGMGIEHANDEYLKKIINKPGSTEEMKKAFLLCFERNLPTVSFNIFGLPFDNVDLMLETIRFNAKVKVWEMITVTYYPVPNTKLGDICKKENLDTVKLPVKSWPNRILNQPSVTTRETHIINTVSHIVLYIYSLIYRYVPEKVQQEYFDIQNDLLKTWIRELSQNYCEELIAKLKKLDYTCNTKYKENIDLKLRKYARVITSERFQ